jgi:hypothetical protein
MVIRCLTPACYMPSRQAFNCSCPMGTLSTNIWRDAATWYNVNVCEALLPRQSGKAQLALDD